MIRISQIKVKVNEETDKSIEKQIKKLLKTDASLDYTIVRKSIDARNKPEIFYVYTVDVNVPNEDVILKKNRNKNITKAIIKEYAWPKRARKSDVRPIIVGLGPAGLFCAYMLAKAGANPICIERGDAVENRELAVKKFWETGILDTESNVQFGEGGAGTFSDGKLNTLVNDKFGRNDLVLKIFVENGAPKEILYDSKPHIGTDILSKVVISMREYIKKNGGEIHYRTKLTDIIVESFNDKKTVKGIRINNNDIIYTDTVVLALGHSARDTFDMLYKNDIYMTPKAFAVGIRIQHPSDLIDESQYGSVCDKLPAATYKLTYHSSFGRGVYSFCMCPGGYVVNASSEENALAINGMSYYARDSKVSNSALIVTVTPDDYSSEDALAGVEFQRQLERKAYEIGEGKIPSICFKDFKQKAITMLPLSDMDDKTKFMGNTKYPAKVYDIFPTEITDSLVEGIEFFGQKIKGFSNDDCIISGVESRTSSPLRIERNEKHMSISCEGIYPCGEGAGYAGGIMSAAMDGILIAEEIWRNE